TARVYRTGFDDRGLYECTPLGAPATRPEDELRRAYRATWLAMLDGVPLPSPARTAIDVAPFEALARLAADGVTLAARLEREAAALDRSLAPGSLAAGSLDAIERL